MANGFYSQFLASQNLPFTGALLLLLFIGIFQLTGIANLFGDADLDGGVDTHGDVQGLDGLLGWFGIGRLPFLLWLILFLGVYALTGLAGQQTAQALTGAPLDPLLAGIGAGVIALPLTGLLARPLARILPHDESTAVSIDSLIGRTGRITIGTATRGAPARAEIRDVFGHPHQVMVEPDDENGRFETGTMVMLVRRDGHAFRAILYGDHPMLRLD